MALKGTDFAKSFEVTVKSADKTALNEVIAEAGKLAEPDCKSGSDEFEAAFDAAKKVAADEDATSAQVADALAEPQKPAVKPSPNGKVDATEPSGLSKTGASTMAFAVDAVLLLAAGAAMVGGAGAPSKARAAFPPAFFVVAGIALSKLADTGRFCWI